MQSPASPDRPHYLTGVELGPYYLQTRLGQGGMGVVYRGLDRHLNRLVAVKVLSPQAVGEEFLRRFAQEAAIMASLQHPHILPVFDYGERDGVLYLVTPYVPGGTLQARLRAGLPMQEGLALLRQVCEGLAYAHARGVVHRDVKPANVLLRADDWALLGDFGLARQEASSPQLTHSGLVLGTPEYISPEQAAGSRGDARSDLYAVGVLLYQVLTGTLPFRASTPMGVLLNHLQAPVPRATAACGSLSPVWDAVVARALAKRPEDRYQTAEELIAALDDAGQRAAWERAGGVATTPVPGPGSSVPPATIPAPPATELAQPLPEGRAPSPLEASSPGPVVAVPGPLAAPASDAAGRQRSLDRAFQRAQGLVAAGEAPQAERVLTVLLQQMPDHTEAAQLLAHLRRGAPPTAHLDPVVPTTALPYLAVSASVAPGPARRPPRPRGAMCVALFSLFCGFGLLASAALTLLDAGQPPGLTEQLDETEAVGALLSGALLLAAILALLLPWPRDRRHSRRGRWEAVALALSLSILAGGVAFALVETGYLPRPPLALAINGGLGLVATLLGLALAWGAAGGPPTAGRTGTGSTGP